MKTPRFNSLSYQLRPYQKDCIDCILNSLKEEKKADVYASVGSGKTVIFSYLSSLSKNPIVIFVPRTSLIFQTLEKLKLFNVDCAPWYGGEKKQARVIVSTVHSMKTLPNTVERVIIDEAHMMTQKQKEIIEKFKPKYIIRFTGTPWSIPDWRPCYELPMKKLIEMNFLVSPMYFAPSNQDLKVDVNKLKVIRGEFSESSLMREYGPKVFSHVDYALRKTKDRTACIWICVNIEHAENVSKLVPNSVLLTSKQTYFESLKVLNDFKSGKIKHIISVSKINVGFDAPHCDTLVFMRATKSIDFWIQSVGRVLRTHHEKKDAFIIDYGENTSRLGLAENFKGTPVQNKLKTCFSCDFIYDKDLQRCPQCHVVSKEFCSDCFKFVSNEEKKFCNQCPQLIKKNLKRDLLKSLIGPEDLNSLIINNFSFFWKIPKGRKMKLYETYISTDNGKKIFHFEKDEKSLFPLNELNEIKEACKEKKAWAWVNNKGHIKALETDKSIFEIKTGKYAKRLVIHPSSID